MSSRRTDRLRPASVVSHLGVMVAVAAVMGVARGRPGDPLRRRRRAVGASTVADGDGQAPGRARGRAAGAAHPDRSTATATCIATLYDENRVNVPLSQGRADHGQGDRRDRGLPLLPARRPRPEGHAARLRHQPGQRRRRPGWLVDHPADGQDDAARPGQDQGGAQGGDRRHLRSARSTSCATRSPSSRSTPRTGSSSATSTSPTSATAPTASRPPPGTTSTANAKRPQPARRPRCSPAW